MIVLSPAAFRDARSKAFPARDPNLSADFPMRRKLLIRGPSLALKVAFRTQFCILLFFLQSFAFGLGHDFMPLIPVGENVVAHLHQINGLATPKEEIAKPLIRALSHVLHTAKKSSPSASAVLRSVPWRLSITTFPCFERPPRNAYIFP